MGNFLEYFTHDLWRVMHPLGYHGEGKTGPFFEGWYCKLVSPDGAYRISVIPGIYIGKKEKDSHSFIQVIDGVDGSSKYITFSARDFRFLPREMDIHIADNHFSQKKIELNLNTANFKMVGNLVFNGLNEWPVTPLSPGVMGWYAWVPGMECYHGIVSMDHEILGVLEINGKKIDFSGGRGYMEKDWGKAMPRAWIWAQSNHFGLENTSLTVSIAEIPWGRRSFIGFLSGFLLEGKLHRFATYNGARGRYLSVSDTDVQIVLQGGSKRLSITAQRAQGFNLQAPTVTQMDRRIMETLSADLDVLFERKSKRKWERIFSGSGQFSGLEVVCDTSSLI